MFMLGLRAAEKGIRAAVKSAATHVDAYVDNQGVQYALKKEHCALRAGNILMRRLVELLERTGVTLTVECVPTGENPADELSRRAKKGDSAGSEIIEKVAGRDITWEGTRLSY